jgi:hypothetical protein
LGIVTKMLRSLTLATLAIAGGPAHAQPTKLRVAVVPTVAVNLDPTRVDALAQDLADALAAELVIDAVGGIEVRRQIRSDLPADCASQPACAKEVATATNAQQILFVVFVDTGNNGGAQIDATWVDPATGHSAARPGVSLTSTADADAKAKFREAAASLLPEAPVRPKPKAQGAVSIDGKLIGGVARHVTTPAMITAGVAVVGVGASIAFGLSTRSKYNSCQADPVGCTQSQHDTISHYALLTDVSWIVAAAAVIGTGVFYATSGEAPHIIAAPAESGTGATVSWSGRF